MTQKNRFEKWEKIREKGRKHFIIYYGILGWGLLTGILFNLIGEPLDHGLHFSEYFSGDWLKESAINTLIFMIGGIFFGYAMWGVNENNYHDKYMNPDRNE